jgi:hypothetical protein
MPSEMKKIKRFGGRGVLVEGDGLWVFASTPETANKAVARTATRLYY